VGWEGVWWGGGCSGKVLNIRCALLKSLVENHLVSLSAKALSVGMLLGILMNIRKNWPIMVYYTCLVFILEAIVAS